MCVQERVLEGVRTSEDIRGCDGGVLLVCRTI